MVLPIGTGPSAQVLRNPDFEVLLSTTCDRTCRRIQSGVEHRRKRQQRKLLPETVTFFKALCESSQENPIRHQYTLTTTRTHTTQSPVRTHPRAHNHTFVHTHPCTREYIAYIKSKEKSIGVHSKLRKKRRKYISIKCDFRRET